MTSHPVRVPDQNRLYPGQANIHNQPLLTLPMAVPSSNIPQFQRGLTTPRFKIHIRGMSRCSQQHGRAAGGLLLPSLSRRHLVSHAAGHKRVPHVFAEGARRAKDEEDKRRGGRGGREQGKVATRAGDAEVGCRRHVGAVVARGGAELEADDDDLEEAADRGR